MILTDTKILEELAKGTIVISPFDRKYLWSNSYDVHLARHLAVYANDILDARAHNEIVHFEIPEEGLLLLPHRLYLDQHTWPIQVFIFQDHHHFAGDPGL